MPGVTEEQIKLAREVDLLTYLQINEPQELLPPKNGEYRTKTHSSLVISNGQWYWHRGKCGSANALDFLIKVRGMGFVDAVEAVLGARSIPAFSSLIVEKAEPPPKWKFYPPRPQRYSNRAVSYLQQRGISPEVINRAIQAGILYESRYYNPASEYHNAAVCVFAGKDETGKTVFATMRGIDTNFKQDKAGSNKRFNFTLPAKNPDSRHLAVFEAPVDLLSHAALQQRNGWDWDGHRLSLGGISDVALISFLERNPQISRIMLYLDNDAAGLNSARNIKSELAADNRFRHIRVSVNPPRGAKDYNDALLRVIGIDKEQKQQTRREADILI